MYDVLYPESPVTRQHIVNYDRLQEFTAPLPVKYIAFPQKGTTMAILKDALVETGENSVTISKSDSSNLNVIFFNRYLHPLTITYRDVVREIAINFNETGINYFFPELFSNPRVIRVYDGGSLHLAAENLFNESRALPLEYLESYFKGRHRILPISGIEKAIALIQEDPALPVTKIAAQVFLTEKTLNRQFQKYVGCTISKYKSIIRFRNTIDSHFKNTTLNLTELCLENNYFDSPHFYKEIKKIASFNPKEFFNQVTASGFSSYPYIFG